MAMGGGRGEYSPCYGGISVTRGGTVRSPLSLRLCPGPRPRRARVQLEVSAQMERQQTSRSPDTREHR